MPPPRQTELFPGEQARIRGPRRPLYAVITVGDGDDVRRASRSGEREAVAEVSLGDSHTLRLTVNVDGTWLLQAAHGTWSECQEPSTLWRGQARGVLL